MAYDNPRPSSQPIGSTDLAVAKDNLTSIDIFVNSEDLTFTNRKGVVKKTVTGAVAVVEDAATQALIDIAADVATVESVKNTAITDINADAAAIDALATSIEADAEARLVAIEEDAEIRVTAIETDAENRISTAVASAGSQIVGDFADVTKVVITEYNQVYTSKSVAGFEDYVWRTNQILPYTPTGSDPSLAPELGKWLAVAIGELKSIARSLNVADNAVQYGKAGVVISATCKYLYVSEQQVTYGLPSTVGVGEVISSVIGDQLETNIGSRILVSLTGKVFAFESIADMKSGILRNNLGVIAWDNVATGTYVPWLGYYTALDGGDNNGILKRGAHVEDGGAIFSIDANTYIESNIKNGTIYVDKFGAVEGVDSSARCQAALNYGAKITKFSAGKSYKCNITHIGGGRTLDLTGATLYSPNDAVASVILQLKNLTWDAQRIIGGRIKGLGMATSQSTGVHFGDQLEGRYHFTNTIVEDCGFAMNKEHGNIGNVFDNVTLVRNRFAFLGTDEAGMHVGNDSWNGGYISGNQYGLLYFNDLMDGWGQIILNGLVIEKNGINFILYADAHAGLFGGFTLNSQWNELGGDVAITVPLTIPRYANHKDFDAVGTYNTKGRTAIVDATSTISGLGLWRTQPYITPKAYVSDASIADSLTTIETATYDILLANYDVNAVSIGTQRVNKLAKVVLSQSRGFCAELPLWAGKQYQIPKANKQVVLTKWTNPIVAMAVSATKYNATYSAGAFTFSLPFASNSYQSMPDVVPDSNPVLIHGLTITLAASISAGAKLIAYLRKDGVHTFGTDQKITIELDKLEVGVPHRFVIAVATDSTKSRGMWWQAVGIDTTVHIQDSYQFTCTESEVPMLYNSRIIPAE